MSKVYSFRLDKNNPREAQAKEVIEARVSQGYSIRHVVVDSLILLGSNVSGKPDLEEILDQIMKSLASMNNEGRKVNTSERELQSAFIGSITKSVKGGLKIKN
jgi:hypothetical protein